ncbi:MAG: hypothetical protein KBT53_04325 [Porticoccus sp.]|nr:hypothetical protein [Porticoccus sp.]
MIRLLLLLAVIFLLVMFIWRLKDYLTRDNKVDELREVKLEGDLIDIDKEIAEEKLRQQDVSSEINDINSKNNTNNKESINEYDDQ